MSTDSSHYRLLIVEDDHAIQDLLKTIAKMYGFDCDIAGDGERGWEQIRTEMHDVIVLDLLLPRKSGYEILRGVKDTMPHLMRRIIIATAALKREIASADLDGVWCVRRKPLDIFDLVREMRLCATQ